jgi:hypothetical protein
MRIEIEIKNKNKILIEELNLKKINLTKKPKKKNNQTNEDHIEKNNIS